MEKLDVLIKFLGEKVELNQVSRRKYSKIRETSPNGKVDTSPEKSSIFLSYSIEALKRLMKTWISKVHPYYAHLKRFAATSAKELKELDPAKRHRMLLIFISFAALNLAYSLFSLYTLLSFGLVITGLYVYVKMGLQDIRKKGLITYLPARYQKILLHRSLFDVLCDMWFIPKVSIYVKALVSPFFLKIDPSEAIHQLKEFPAGSRKIFLTKGVVNVMPNLLKNSLLPQNDLATEEESSSDISSEADRQRSHSLKNIQIKGDISEEKSELEIMLTNEMYRRGSREASILDSLRLSKLDQSSLHNRLTQASTDDDGLVNHNFSMSQQLEVKKTLPSFEDINPLKTHLDYKDVPKNPKGYGHYERTIRNKIRNMDSKATPKLHKTFLHDIDSDLRTEILSSSKTSSVQLNKSLELSEKWDKLELFARKHRERLLMKQNNVGNPFGKKFELKGPLQTLHNIAMLLSKDALMNKLEDKSLIKIFLVSSLVLLVQFSLSKKTRLWCYNTFHILMYITGVALSTGSFGLIMMKLRNKYITYKEEQQRAKALSELKDKEDGEME